MNIFNQSECFISSLQSHTTVRFVYDISSRGWEIEYDLLLFLKLNWNDLVKENVAQISQLI